MKTFFISLLVIIIIGVSIICIKNANIFTENTSQEKIIVIQPKCIGEAPVNTELLYQEYGLEPGTELTWWTQIYSQEDIGRAMERYSAPLFEIDFHTETGIISFGRKLAEIRYDENKLYHDAVSYTAIVTFEESYDGAVAYFYSIDKVMFVPSSMTNTKVYKILNGERTLWGAALWNNTDCVNTLLRDV